MTLTNKKNIKNQHVLHIQNGRHQVCIYFLMVFIISDSDGIFRIRERLKSLHSINCIDLWFDSYNKKIKLIFKMAAIFELATPCFSDLLTMHKYFCIPFLLIKKCPVKKYTYQMQHMSNIRSPPKTVHFHFRFSCEIKNGRKSNA